LEEAAAGAGAAAEEAAPRWPVIPRLHITPTMQRSTFLFEEPLLASGQSLDRPEPPEPAPAPGPAIGPGPAAAPDGVWVAQHVGGGGSVAKLQGSETGFTMVLLPVQVATQTSSTNQSTFFSPDNKHRTPSNTTPLQCPFGVFACLFGSHVSPAKLGFAMLCIIEPCLTIPSFPKTKLITSCMLRHTSHIIPSSDCGIRHRQWQPEVSPPTGLAAGLARGAPFHHRRRSGGEAAHPEAAVRLRPFEGGGGARRPPGGPLRRRLRSVGPPSCGGGEGGSSPFATVRNHLINPSSEVLQSWIG